MSRDPCVLVWFCCTQMETVQEAVIKLFISIEEILDHGLHYHVLRICLCEHQPC